MQMAEIEFGTREGTKEWKRRERKIKFFHLVSRSVCAIITFI